MSLGWVKVFVRTRRQVSRALSRHGIFDLLVDGECPLSVWDGLSALAKLDQRQTHVPLHMAFASAVTNLTGDSQASFIELEGAAGLAQVGPGDAQVTQIS